MSDNYQKLRGLLKELFQLDQSDLDFGIYRIMNQKRDEIVRFLDNDLLPQVKAAFGQYRSADRSVIEADLTKAIEQAHALGVDPDQTNKVKELKAKLSDSSVDVVALESEVYSHLYNFFRRYYDEGDFLSLRRYKEGVYAIPYEGEEVKLHWANADQYYVKSTETFRDYTFKIESGKRVRVHLVAASTEQDNNKPAEGKERRFVLSAEQPLAEEKGELYIQFEYRPIEGNQKQDDLNRKAIEDILATPGYEDWAEGLGKLAPTDRNRNRTVLEKHLAQYTARNTFDYFIHKDLGGFLRRELDFYIKNEVMHLDDIEHESAPKVEQYLSQIKVIRSIALKIIQFLEQLENFQKRLWLKKKFVIETNYCVTLDRVPEELYPDIAANDAQREEWVRLFAIDEIQKDLSQPGFTQPLSVEFLKSNPFLILDTALFDGPRYESFKARLLAGLPDLERSLDGLLIHAENFQALQMLHGKHTNSLDCVYIDPPYNTDASSILYKNGYKNSTWVSLVENRLKAASRLISPTGVLCMAIDDEQVSEARQVLASIFPKVIGVAVVRANPQSRKAKGTFSPVHEYALFYGKSSDSVPGCLQVTDKKEQRYPYTDTKGRYSWMSFIRTGTADRRVDRPKMFYPIFVDKNDKLRVPEMDWSEEANAYLLREQPTKGEVAVYPVVEKDGLRIEKRWHRGFERIAADVDEYRVRRTEDGRVSIDFKTRMDEAATPSTWWDKNEYASSNYGASELKELFGDKPFDFPKTKLLVEDCLRACGFGEGGVVLDFFAGSGTTGHAVIEMIRKDGLPRKYILAESGSYFDGVTRSRVMKAIYSKEWGDGKPIDRQGVSHAFKYVRLESYEDSLNNLEFRRSAQQSNLLDADAKLREQYLLSYMLEVESRTSQSLLNVQSFRNPDAYKLRVERNGETQLANVDLVETFNWLLGLFVKHIDKIRGVLVVEGTNSVGERVLVLWRNLDETDNDKLDHWFERQGYSTRDLEFDLVYVNGDNNLENLRRTDQTWKVRLIEEEFQRLMFDVRDI